VQIVKGWCWRAAPRLKHKVIPLKIYTIEDLKWDSTAVPIILNFNRIAHENERFQIFVGLTIIGLVQITLDILLDNTIAIKIN
jgi:hypothetical protein